MPFRLGYEYVLTVRAEKMGRRLEWRNGRRVLAKLRDRLTFPGQDVGEGA